MQYRINVLALIGALVGIISIFSAWVSAWIIGFNLIDLINIILSANNNNFFGGFIQVNISTWAWILVIGGIVFIIGAFLALLSPVAGIIELIGVSAIIGSIVGGGGSTLPNGIGFYMAIASAIIVIISLIKPIGIGYDFRPTLWKARLLTFSRMPVVPAPYQMYPAFYQPQFYPMTNPQPYYPQIQQQAPPPPQPVDPNTKPRDTPPVG